MTRYLLLILSLCLTQSIYAQLSDWENYSMEENGFIKDAMSDMKFSSGGVVLNNTYVDDPLFPYWIGWIISAGTDVNTPGRPNEHSARPGIGANGSDNYAVTFVFGESIIKHDDYSFPRKFTSLSIANSTYAYKSMLDGDQFAKRFGGEDGNDKDFFILTIKGYKDGAYMSDSINFVLADYRFDNNAEDYILENWETIDLSSIGEADSISLKLFSSDNSTFGMNTPGYLCVDNITWQMVSNVAELDKTKFNLLSNLVSNVLAVTVSTSHSFNIYDRNGQIIKAGYLNGGMNHLNLSGFRDGMYFIKLDDANVPAQPFTVIK